MNLFKVFLACVALFCSYSVADMMVVSVDTNTVANIDKITVRTGRFDDVSLADKLAVNRSGVVFVAQNGRTVSLVWPTNYVSAYTNYPGRFDNYEDPFVTAWYVENAISGLKADLSVFGDHELYTRYTNSPPSNMQSLLGYVSNCVYLLSNVKVEMSYTSLSNEIDQLKTRVERTEITADRFGHGVSDLDYIIDSDMENMDASDMLNMIKTLAMYIKNGSTNAVSTAANTEETAQ